MMTVSAVPVALLRARQLTMPLYCTCSIILWMVVQWLCVVPHGVLFRGNAEGVIRRFLIEKKNCIDAIIGLPANIFYGTSIPTCILVMKKCRKEDDNILFIDASKEFEKVKTQNKLRKEHIDKIVDTYRNRTEIEKVQPPRHLAGSSR